MRKYGRPSWVVGVLACAGMVSAWMVTAWMLGPPQAYAAAAPPSSGTKVLYPGDIAGTQNNPTLPMIFNRNPLTVASAPARVRIRRQDNDRIWQLGIPLQADLTLDGAGMTVLLYMRRNNNSSNRNLRLTVGYNLGASSVLIGCLDVVVPGSGASGLSRNQTRAFLFVVEHTDATCTPSGGGALTVPTGAQLTFALDNQVVGGNGRAIFVYPYDVSSAQPSAVGLPVTTVINVDDQQNHAGAYPVVAPTNEFARGDRVYVRADVSDPFGSYDINSVDYRIEDPTDTVVASGTLTQVQDSGAATAVYEQLYTIPAAGPDGVWTVDVTANEGTEGTISHSFQSTFQVTGANVSLQKDVSVVADSISATNPKMIPGAIVEYVIRATNNSAQAMAADTVILQDSLPPDMRFFFGSPADPFIFADGSPSSGLTFTFTNLADTGDDIQFSNNGGVSFITPVVDAQGFDATVPKINYVEINPKGVFNPKYANFELRFQMRVE